MHTDRFDIDSLNTTATSAHSINMESDTKTPDPGTIHSSKTPLPIPRPKDCGPDGSPIHNSSRDASMPHIGSRGAHILGNNKRHSGRSSPRNREECIIKAVHMQRQRLYSNKYYKRLRENHTDDYRMSSDNGGCATLSHNNLTESFVKTTEATVHKNVDQLLQTQVASSPLATSSALSTRTKLDTRPLGEEFTTTIKSSESRMDALPADWLTKLSCSAAVANLITVGTSIHDDHSMARTFTVEKVRSQKAGVEVTILLGKAFLVVIAISAWLCIFIVMSFSILVRGDGFIKHWLSESRKLAEDLVGDKDEKASPFLTAMSIEIIRRIDSIRAQMFMVQDDCGAKTSRTHRAPLEGQHVDVAPGLNQKSEQSLETKAQLLGVTKVLEEHSSQCQQELPVYTRRYGSHIVWHAGETSEINNLKEKKEHDIVLVDNNSDLRKHIHDLYKVLRIKAQTHENTWNRLKAAEDQVSVLQNRIATNVVQHSQGMKTTTTLRDAVVNLRRLICKLTGQVNKLVENDSYLTAELAARDDEVAKLKEEIEDRQISANEAVAQLNATHQIELHEQRRQASAAHCVTITNLHDEIDDAYERANQAECEHLDMARKFKDLQSSTRRSTDIFIQRIMELHGRCKTLEEEHALQRIGDLERLEDMQKELHALADEHGDSSGSEEWDHINGNEVEGIVSSCI